MPLQARHIFLTGQPGVGKTTLACAAVKEQPASCGFYTAEKRAAAGEREGFSVVALGSGETGTLASLAFLWPRLRADPTATLLLNPCTTGRDHATSRRNRSVAPDFWPDGRGCAARPYVRALLGALGVPGARVLAWPYTRQPRGPALRAARASFMCAHPLMRKH